MRLLLFLLALFISSPAVAEETLPQWHLLDLDEFSMETGRLVNYADAYLSQFGQPASAAPERWDTYTAANFDLTLLGFTDRSGDAWKLYWDNQVAGASTNERYRMVTWHWAGGIDLAGRAQLFWEHQSLHALDDAPVAGHFPLFNMYGARIVFYRRADRCADVVPLPFSSH